MSVGDTARCYHSGMHHVGYYDSQSFSKIPDHPLLESCIRPVVACRVGGTTLALESLELEAGTPDCACIEMRGYPI